MDSSVSAKDKIWFLRVCHHISKQSTTSFNMKNKKSTFYSLSAFVCFLWISEQTGVISLSSVNLLVFITGTKCVYCAVRAEFLHIIHINCGLFFAETRIRYQVRLCKIYNGKSCSGTGFSTSTSVFLCQFLSTKAPYSSPFTCSFTCWSNRKVKWAKP